ncbi:hypothetical protein HN018_12360 [Lichenicola cladoniae]|uniref:Uncharacterized protein n=1 Tax=Lichenicola cladoniae TaxID=1484109 RepID=A0A6M8HR20_9PROT|nr:hypothetical protein [Lichenicola cladoniae]NPD68156.1 hypothetical protein [Acetobacteraceae bacterium]QKE90725.1 hypothetical protein HN018_12360 [Lichenicola cladoniae]
MQINPVGAAAPIDVAPGRGKTCADEAAASSPTGAGRVPATRLLNPQPTIDPALGIVVTEYFNQSGELTAQYPSARAVDSYRIYGLHDPDAASSPVHD